jgi:hypothetical protein
MRKPVHRIVPGNKSVGKSFTVTLYFTHVQYLDIADSRKSINHTLKGLYPHSMQNNSEIVSLITPEESSSVRRVGGLPILTTKFKIRGRKKLENELTLFTHPPINI